MILKHIGDKVTTLIKAIFNINDCVSNLYLQKPMDEFQQAQLPWLQYTLFF